MYTYLHTHTLMYVMWKRWIARKASPFGLCEHRLSSKVMVNHHVSHEESAISGMPHFQTHPVSYNTVGSIIYLIKYPHILADIPIICSIDSISLQIGCNWSYWSSTSWLFHGYLIVTSTVFLEPSSERLGEAPGGRGTSSGPETSCAGGPEMSFPGIFQSFSSSKWGFPPWFTSQTMKHGDFPGGYGLIQFIYVNRIKSINHSGLIPQSHRNRILSGNFVHWKSRKAPWWRKSAGTSPFLSSAKSPKKTDD